MGIDPMGGFIQGIVDDVINEVKGVLRPETRTLEVPIAPGIVARALRLWHRMKVPVGQRIEHIAYVFIEKADAYQHLHKLWVREFECRYMYETGRHRIDIEYHRTPNPAEWVKRLDAR